MKINKRVRKETRMIRKRGEEKGRKEQKIEMDDENKENVGRRC
jgi:hypothetical protein